MLSTDFCILRFIRPTKSSRPNSKSNFEVQNQIRFQIRLTNFLLLSQTDEYIKDKIETIDK